MPRTIPRLRRPLRPEPAPRRKRWTRKECDWLRENGLLTGRYELIDGEIIDKMGQNRPHAIVIVLLLQWLSATFGGDRVQCQLPINVAEADNEHNEPEPDGAAFAQPVTAYTERSPGPADLLLVVEVADTTLRFDRRTKAALYARAGIVEHWVIDIAGRQIFVHRRPAPDGYAQTVAYAAHETLAPLARPEAAVRVAELLPPA